METLYTVCPKCQTGLAPVATPPEAGEVIVCACDREYMRSAAGEWYARIQEQYRKLTRADHAWLPVEMATLIMGEAEPEAPEAEAAEAPEAEARIRLEAVRGSLLAAMMLAADLAEQRGWDLLWILDIAKAHSEVCKMLEASSAPASSSEVAHGASCACPDCLERSERAFTVWHDGETPQA